MSELAVTKDNLPITIGRLAAFAACCVLNRVKRVDQSAELQAALNELVYASSDHYAYSIDNLGMPDPEHLEQAHSSESSSGTQLTETSVLSQHHSPEYWAVRLFKFLGSVSELKAFRKDDPSMLAFDLFV